MAKGSKKPSDQADIPLDREEHPEFGGPGVGGKYAGLASALVDEQERQAARAVHPSSGLRDTSVSVSTKDLMGAKAAQGRVVGRFGAVLISVDPEAVVTDQARDIVTRLLPRALNLFLEKNKNYRNVDNSLGARGVFPDVYRKVGVLKARLWDGFQHNSAGESTREVIQDLVGHLWLILHMLDDEEGKRPEGWPIHAVPRQAGKTSSIPTRGTAR